MTDFIATGNTTYQTYLIIGIVAAVIIIAAVVMGIISKKKK